MNPRSSLGRLARDGDFRVAYREGARHVTTHLVIYARPNTLNTVRLGVVVGKRFGRATVRNRLRRRLREATRSLAAQIQAGVDLVLSPRVGAVAKSFGDLRDEMKTGLTAARVLREETEQP
jgi:ribonuclease P protein component